MNMGICWFNKALIGSLILLCVALCFGKPAGSITGSGHNGDITRILGLDTTNEKQRVLAQEICDAFAQFIDSQDDANRLNTRIKTIAPSFSWGLYTHRIFFHWGFNGDPHRSSALTYRIQTSGASAKDVSKIWEIILKEQSKRNKAMMKAVEMGIRRKNGNCFLRSCMRWIGLMRFLHMLDIR